MEVIRTERRTVAEKVGIVVPVVSVVVVIRIVVEVIERTVVIVREVGAREIVVQAAVVVGTQVGTSQRSIS